MPLTRAPVLGLVFAIKEKTLLLERKLEKLRGSWADEPCKGEPIFLERHAHLESGVRCDIKASFAVELEGILATANSFRKRVVLGRRAKQLLSAWARSHSDSPYPTKEEKQQLARQCDISLRQLSVWFTNNRARRWKGKLRRGGNRNKY